MVRSMYSGVTGMKAHQTKLDVIGNNIANVNTYGFKSSRATFRDVYYQSLRNAAAPTGNSGGTNPSGVGYGSSIASVDLLMTQSTVTNTGNPMDVAINGDGFFQVQDSDGNTFYTRAGMLDIDSDGNVVDMNGYFVLGISGSPVGQKPSSNKINVLNSIGSVPAQPSSVTGEAGGRKITVKATNSTTEGNISFNFKSSEDLPIGQKAAAVVGTSNIMITLNAKETFGSVTELSAAINAAITQANNGKAHPAGDFTVSFDPESAFSTPLTGDQICGGNFGYDLGSINFPSGGILGFQFDSVGSGFTTVPKLEWDITRTHGADGDTFTVTATDGSGKTYTGTVTQSQMDSSGKLRLTNNGSETDFIAVSFPTYNTLIAQADIDNTVPTWEFTDYGAANGGGLAAFKKDCSNGKFLGGTTLTGTWPDTVAPAKPTLEYVAGANGTAGTFTLNIAGYEGKFAKDKCGQELTLTSTAGATPTTLSVKLPSFENILSASNTGLAFPIIPDITGDDIKGSTPSLDLGLETTSFRLVNGTEGGKVETKDLTGIAIGADGVIVATHPILGRKEVGRIDLANFNNPAALVQSGNSYYEVSSNSGAAGLSIPGSGGTGGLKTSSLELSNVDLSQEFADMITTQRGFQANSRMITVSDTLLEELVNLKR